MLSRFYKNLDAFTLGYEGQLRLQLVRRREAQLAAVFEQTASHELLSYGPLDSAQERWLQRTLNQAGEQLAQIRERLFANADIQRHHLVLDLNAGNGLLTWEVLRRVPEGGVYAFATTATDAIALQEQTQALPDLQRPLVLQGDLTQLTDLLQAQAPKVQFDWIIGRNCFLRVADKTTLAVQLRPRLHPLGQVLLADVIPQQGQRLYGLLSDKDVETKLMKRWRQAEERIYDPKVGDPLLNWDVSTLSAAFERAGFTVSLDVEPLVRALYVTPQLIARWFEPGVERCSYGDRLRDMLTPKEVERVRALITQFLCRQTVQWSSPMVYIRARLASGSATGTM
ncbi:MAG: hypothetical protein WCD18_06225 [Thermosynechococcaceae cyanobacterium]